MTLFKTAILAACVATFAFGGGMVGNVAHATPLGAAASFNAGDSSSLIVEVQQRRRGNNNNRNNNRNNNNRRNNNKDAAIAAGVLGVIGGIIASQAEPEYYDERPRYRRDRRHRCRHGSWVDHRGLRHCRR